MADRAEVKLYRWDDMPVETVKQDLGRRMISGDRMMIAHVYLDKGCEVPWHHHDNEQLVYVLEGSMRFWFEDDDGPQKVVHDGEVLVIPPNVPHKAVALEDTLDVDVFSPPREDWLDGNDDYLR